MHSKEGFCENKTAFKKYIITGKIRKTQAYKYSCLLEMKGRWRLSKYGDEQENQTFAADTCFLKRLCGAHGVIVELCGTLQNVLWHSTPVPRCCISATSM